MRGLSLTLRTKVRTALVHHVRLLEIDDIPFHPLRNLWRQSRSECQRVASTGILITCLSPHTSCYQVHRQTADPVTLGSASSHSITTRVTLMSPVLRYVSQHLSLPASSSHGLSQVAHRVLAGTVPLKYNLIDALRPNPDLYGPFWLCMTLIFTTAISGNVALLFQ